MAEKSLPSLAVADLRAIVADPSELAKGSRVFDEGGIAHLARFENRIFCEARGGGPSPYRVAITFAQGVRARCNCMAARSRPFCKHAAALLVAFARAPESFVTSESPPRGDGRKKTVKRGGAQARELMRRGIEQVETLVRELGISGVNVARDRVGSIHGLGETLREHKLRRLSARTLDLVKLLDGSLAKGAVLSVVAYTDIVADLLVTAQKLGRHLEGEPLDDRHVEELVGKTWRAAERTPVSGLDLIEVAYSVRVTSDDYVIRESRFVDLVSGDHFAEKQIVPKFLARRTDPKRSRAGSLHTGVRGSLYPGYPPRRLEIADLGDPRPIDDPALELLVERALPDVGAALAAFQEHRRDVFAPDVLPAAVRIDTLFARGERMQAVDRTGEALHLPPAEGLEERLGMALRDGKLAALVGDVRLDAALPTLVPFAAVLRTPLGFELRALSDAEPPKRRARARPKGEPWAVAAREAGVTRAAIELGEVREELAEAFAFGLAAFGRRSAEPLAARLRDLSLPKQAAVLEDIARRPDAFARIDDFVRVHKILELALLRLSGTASVDRNSLSRVPGFESVYANVKEREGTPAAIAGLRLAGALNRYEAAVLYARHYEGVPEEELRRDVHGVWSDASAAPFVARSFASRGEEAVEAASRVLASAKGRMTKLTAVRILEAVPGEEAIAALARWAKSEDLGLAARARAAHDARATEPLGPPQSDVLEAVRLASAQLFGGRSAEDRVLAVNELLALEHVAVVPELRRAFLGDGVREVRKAAAEALAVFLDPELLDPLLRLLRCPEEEERDVRLAAHALGLLGDVRGIRALVDALAAGERATALADGLKLAGAAAVAPLLDALEAKPELAGRKAVLGVLAALPEGEVEAELVARIERAGGSFDEDTALTLKIVAALPGGGPRVLEAVRRRAAGAIDESLERALEKARS